LLWFIDVQWQSGNSDCGLFATAVVTALAYDVQPESLLFDQRQMRDRMCNCCMKGQLSMFPTLKKSRSHHKLWVIFPYAAVECHRTAWWYNAIAARNTIMCTVWMFQALS
jgi:hypothetical protein